MITGTVPFNADSAVSIAIMQLQKEAQVPSAINPSIPKGIEQITMHAMQKNPKERYQSAAEMLMDLKEISENPTIVFPYVYTIGMPYQPSADVTDPTDEQNLVDLLEKEEDAEADALSGNKSDEYYREKYGVQKGDEEKDPNKKKKVGIIVGVCAGVAAIVAVLCILIFGGEKISVPKFVGLNYNEDIAKYVTEDTYNNGEVKCKIKLEYTDDVEKYPDADAGDVVYQSPEAGIKMKSSKYVTLTILSNEEGTKIPDIIGMTKDAAQIELTSKGFKNVSFEEKPSKDVAAGNVISTSPQVGTKLDKQTKITVYISSGSKFKMPNVVGMSKSDAEKFLDDYDLKITYEDVDSEKTKGTVLEQSISEGSKVEMGSGLTLKVSTGTAPTTETTTETTTEAKEKNVNIKMNLPTENGQAVPGGDGKLKIYLGNQLVDNSTVKCNGGVYTFTATGKSGTKELSAEVDGSEIMSCIVNFDTGTYQ